MHSWKIIAAAAALACAASAQTATPQKPVPTPAPAPHATASAADNPHEPVITIQNLCVPPKAGAACKTVITRAEFEKILNAIRPNLPANARMQIAQKYVEVLTFADKAQQEGLDKSPEFQEQLHLLRMQALASAYTKHVQEKYAQPSDAEVDKYYQDNKPAYEEVTLRRIYIPKPMTGGEKKPPLDEAATKALAEKIQARAAAGEDFDKLQAETFTAQNPDAKATAPPTTMGNRRRGQLPASQESKIFDLKPGEVTPLLEEPAGYFIYKVENRQVLPLDKVKGQIARQLEEQKMRDKIEGTLNSVKPTFNESYFKASAEPGEMPGGKGPQQPPSERPASGPPSTQAK